MEHETKESRLFVLQRQVERFQRRLDDLKQTSYRWSWIRVAAFAIGLLASGAAFYFLGAWPGGIVLILAAIIFGAAVYVHSRVDRSILRHQLWLGIKSTQMARMRLDWAHIPLLSWHRPRAQHPFEFDLDLVGRQSLLHLLDTTASYEGSRRLRDWLTAPEPQALQTMRRQALVRALAPLRLFRDRFRLNAAVAAEGKKTWEADQLLAWLKGQTLPASLRRWLIVAGVLAGLNIALFTLNRLGWAPPLWPITWFVYMGLVLVTARTGETALSQTVAVHEALQQFGAVFRQLERFSCPSTSHLQALCAPFHDLQYCPSTYLPRITRVMAALSIRGNGLAWFVLNALVPWDLYFVHRLNQYKQDLAQRMPVWIDTWFELDALIALADFAFLNPAYTFPNITTDEDKLAPVFEARGLGHPLIPDEQKVCNDLSMNELGEIVIITGSNMAGKSVFLKTMGVNLALAYAGGPVNARYLSTRPFRLFTCIKISDSIADGMSYFYAEVKRLKVLLAELERDHSLPLIFFIDELFRGTNNRERLMGSQAYVSTLAGKAGVGFIATHDLELARLADQRTQIKNYHFGDAFVDGRLVFDYTLHSGPCPTTNALNIMALEGLIPLAPT